jgi:hypothetical protein
MIKKLAFAAMALYSTFLSAEELRYENQIFDTRVKTVVLTKAGTDDRYPIIALNSNDQLELSFDILGNKNDYFQYTLIHCDAGWNPTSLGQNEYLRGLTFDNITDFKYSTNTYVKYVHYNLLLPNENMKPIFAGNYLIKVYRNFDEEELVLTRRMMILNPAVSIDGAAKPATLAQHRFTKQEVGFSVNYRGFNIPDPYKDVNVVLMQNGQWDNTITGLKPLFIRDNTLDYNYYDQTLFSGGNEFRFFDIRSLRQFSQNVRAKTLDSVYHCFLNYEESRGSKQYFNYLDFNGKRVIANRDGQNAGIDGDYAFITFYLLSLTPLNEDVYVYGEFTDWRLLPEYKMYYNKSRLRYELEVQLKQGRYEYKYATQTADGKIDDTTIEGSHAQTENEYMVLIYHKNIQYKYDELVGSRVIKTQF